MKKFLVLSILFLLPIVAYLFFASGINNFAKLPVLTEHVENVSNFESRNDSIVSFQDKISVVAFFGNDPESLKGNTFNLDQKILQKFYGFQDFQFVVVLPESAKGEVNDFVEEFDDITNSQHWKFVYAPPALVMSVFNSFKTNIQLDDNLQTPYVFLIDKDRNLRGRDDDENEGLVYGYDSRSVSELNNKMNDDVKVILAEYRLELKKYKKQQSE